jgi:hypothetical protein
VDPDASDRIARLERQADYLLRHLGIDREAAASGRGGDIPALDYGPAAGFGSASAVAGQDTITPELLALLQQRKWIQAIKLYRR